MPGPASKKLKMANGSAEDVKTEPEIEHDQKNGLPTVDDFPQQIINARLNAAASISDFKFNKKRVRVLSEAEAIDGKEGGVLYWMIRDQRVQDNWAFLYAQRLALKQKAPLHVAFCIPPKYYDQTIRHYTFMLEGLREVATECRNLHINFHLLYGDPGHEIVQFCRRRDIAGVVVDFMPLKVPTKWIDELVDKMGDELPICQVDAHNIVPCWQASPKCEYGARTIRTKIHNVLNDYLTEFPPVIAHPHNDIKVKAEPIDWDTALDNVKVDRDAEATAPVTWAKPGTAAGTRELKNFMDRRLKLFNTDRNNPNKNALSNLSPWLHFGHISIQRCIIMVNAYKSKYKESVAAFVEESVVRRELADNYCFYNENYDSIKGAYAWAQETLKKHKNDKREYVYTQEEFENAKTHDDLWNAAQLQVRKEGKMHGFLRMYWAKKILEWTPSPEEAFRIALLMNDKFNLDGTDPNGYVGVAWSVCGVHDQGWAERDVFGKIRFMNYKGCQRKFDVASFVKKYGATSHVKGQMKLSAAKKKK